MIGPSGIDEPDGNDLGRHRPRSRPARRPRSVRSRAGAGSGWLLARPQPRTSGQVNATSRTEAARANRTGTRATGGSEPQ